ncbi:MAG TPA: amidase [Bacteroidales bacterium]|nr:amidase [Bacteroidales bacterium]HBZ21744.1 amidase [Bacteroidales bacterium]
MIEKGKVPEIQVGIFSAKEICFTLNSSFIEKKSGALFSGKWVAGLSGVKVVLRNESIKHEMEAPVYLVPADHSDSSFTLQAVTIGVDFHWQRKEDQVFRGSLRLITGDNMITAVNILPVEDYLISVISSEMRATSSEEFLKAHSVISRSWLLAQIEKSKKIKSEGKKYNAVTINDNEIVRWYDREDHQNYDVCADDHCQRYQGITRASSPAVEKVIMETYGEVLTFEGSICDTRYYKCCGGMTEQFENVWEPVRHPYLQGIIDNSAPVEGFSTDLTKKEGAEKWILENPEAFCNTTDQKVLSQVLNDYDQETNDFFRWKVVYTQQELSDLVKLRTGNDFGIITDLIPLERGVSGRITRLKIEGTLKTMILGKELEIRKSLSKSHLYSSCFFVEKAITLDGTKFILHGAGWGHGVGLCQIGAAMMGSKGYTYRQILMHYFIGATFEKLYHK